MNATDLVIHDATPAIADGVRPIEYTDRKARLGQHCDMHTWARQTPGFVRVANSRGFDPKTHGITVISGPIEDDDDLRPEFAAAGAVCCVYLTFPVTAETFAAGGAANVSIIGLSSDGCRAIVYDGGEWVPTAAVLYP